MRVADAIVHYVRLELLDDVGKIDCHQRQLEGIKVRQSLLEISKYLCVY